MTTDRPPVAGIDDGDHRARFLAARDHLVSEHLELARSIARNVHASLPPSFDLDDLTQTGYMALIRAATRYRPRDHGGAPFSAYARSVIRGAILDSVRRGKYEESTRPPLEQAAEPESEPTVERLIDELRARRAVRDAVAYLNGRERVVLGMYYGDPPLTFAQIGERLGCCRETASDIHRAAIERLRTRHIPILRDAA